MFIEIYENLDHKLRVHNEYVSRIKFIETKQLVCPLEGKDLDSQQICCISKKVQNHLVLAGAGTGKTTTIIGFVKYILKKGYCEDEDVLILSFTNASALEMSKRLKGELEVNVEVQTFHKLGLNIITSVEEKKQTFMQKIFVTMYVFS